MRSVAGDAQHALRDRLLTRMPVVRPDRVMLIVVLIAALFGLVMMTSASMPKAERWYGEPYYYLQRQAVFLVLAAVVMAVMTRVPVRWLARAGVGALLLAMLLMVAVLIPGVGHTAQGATRWIDMGMMKVQVSEFVKLAVVLYLAGYLVRRGDEVRSRLTGFLKPMALFAVIAALLLKQPDFGAAMVILSIVLAMMFVAGVRFWQFVGLFVVTVLGAVMVAVAAPYRLRRMTSFIDPWADPYENGFQLTQALIAIGRGEWFGVGLGAGVQKLLYLPEAHTDFLFAVIAEELGMAGGVAVVLLFGLLLARVFRVGLRANRAGMPFAAYVALGIGCWLGLQVVINLGVNMGLLPTKGLTLPLMSYGGSSLIITAMALGIVIAIDREVSEHFLNAPPIGRRGVATSDGILSGASP